MIKSIAAVMSIVPMIIVLLSKIREVPAEMSMVEIDVISIVDPLKLG